MTDIDLQQPWTFKSSIVAEEFDSHVNKQLPWYGILTEVVVEIARTYAAENGVIYDLGAATGNISRALKDIVVSRNIEMINVEPAEEMLQKWHGHGDVIRSRAQDVDFQPFDLAVSFLTVAFVHPEERVKLLDRLLEKKRAGGAIILVEKFLDRGNPRLNTRIGWRLKEVAGETPNEIYAKEQSINGMLRPLREEEIIYREGAEEIDWFFQLGDFSGCVIR